MIKRVQLNLHPKTFSEADLIINLKEFPGAKEGDIVEIYQPEDIGPRLLLQVTTFKDDLLKEKISVEQSIATTFQLRNYADVFVRIVDANEVALDSVEITFKDQYMGRSEMWRIKNSLTNTCVYINKKLEFLTGAIRCQVYEMWSQGDRVACGVITEDTNIVFRSSTSMVYLFIQMSSEMWDFDIHGDLYFEKAVNGFLSDLFAKWKKHGSNHEVTIVLFSRTFYKAQSLEEFPLHMRECLQLDYRGRYYEDFYRVAVQNERYDDWSLILVQLRRLFTDYQYQVLHYYEKTGVKIPPAMNSTAAQGNFLEVLNMSLNVFEKHYLERNLDRTGQLSVVITPGVGVFEVDRELTNVTKQRIIDNGVGSDLVCVGEQPLHAVPLLKFHNKDSCPQAIDDYSMPHWINLSFYSTNKKVAYSNFIPRIKLPPKMLSSTTHIYDVPTIPSTTQHRIKKLEDEERIHNSFFDYDAYDAQVFHLPSTNGTSSLQRTTINQKLSKKPFIDTKRILRRKMSDPDIHHLHDKAATMSKAITIPPSFTNVGVVYDNDSSPLISPIVEEERINKLSPPYRVVVGSAGSPPSSSSTTATSAAATAVQSATLRPGRALINPFDPSHVTIKLTSNRRRWTHIFPKGPTGVLIQQHHYQAVPTSKHTLNIGNNSPTSNKKSSISTSSKRFMKHKPSKTLTLLWGATGEQEWTPALTTGVDWKSLTIPACLPITTDYFPDKRSLQNDYVVSDYNLLPDDVNADFAQQRAIYKKPLTTKEVFKELVSQRLAHGFQLIVLPKTQQIINNGTSGGLKNGNQQQSGSLVVGGRPTNIEPTEQYLLSIGRIFHKISLCGNAITVTRYRPRHPYPPFDIHYRYRFHAPHHDTYEISWAQFTTEKLENYSWNYLDHYICTRGDTDYDRFETLKYWRFRAYLLPFIHPATKKILDGHKHCDIYNTSQEFNTDDNTNLVEGFLRFVEMYINKLKRPNTKNKQRASISVINSVGLFPGIQAQLLLPRRYSLSVITTTTPSTFQYAASRLIDRSIPSTPARSSSKVERGRVSPATEAVLPVQSSEIGLSINVAAIATDDNDDGVTPLTPTLKSTASLPEILSALCQSKTGVEFLLVNVSLPKQTFVSGDAVYWLLSNLEGLTSIEQAVSIFNSMINNQLICHASGDFSKQFIFGFYLYYVVHNQSGDNENSNESSDNNSLAAIAPIGDLQTFENEWLEVEIRDTRGWGGENTTSENGVAHFLRETIDNSYLQGDVDSDIPLYRHTHLDTDVSLRSDRIEWAHLRYQTVYRPDQPYELQIQWLASSAAIIADLMNGWMRKAQPCGFQIVPIPADLLSLPFTSKSDPLRGPIFIPLNTDCLLQSKTYLFEEFREETWAERLFLFQESIVARFGFMPCSIESANVCGSGDASIIHDHQYVHRTGCVFILIPSPPAIRPRQRVTSITQRRTNHTSRYHPISCSATDPLPSPHHAYITRHVTSKNKEEYDNSKKMGFLWSWNHMVSRRSRTNSTPTPATAGDDALQTNMLRDFREFCNNTDARLRTYWDQCWEIKENASTKQI